MIGNKDHLSEACRGGEVQRAGWELRVNGGRGKGSQSHKDGHHEHWVPNCRD